ncbi:hypothetical protein [Pontixanthobacter sp.]|uniref:hypothetical protein n=1 Tax=Pontixanthobacter sp. TaxID=2792078 RepID=UPI003C7C9911
MTSHTLKTAFRPASHVALAIALVSGAAVGISAFADTAHAQKRDRDKPAKSDYSKGFVEAYSPVEALTKADAPDMAAIRAALPGVTAAIETPDDRMAGGGLLYNVGNTAKDISLQRQGLDLMIESGKLSEQQMIQYLVSAGQLASDDGDHSAARSRFSQAIDAGYNSSPALEGVIAETYFKEDKYAEGLAYLGGVIDGQHSAGQKADENWYKRGIAVAYSNDLANEAIKFSTDYARAYPSATSWGDAIAVQRTFLDYDNNAVLDLLRLADRTKSLREGRDYADYIDAADARRLPGEVKRIVEMGLAAEKLQMSDPFVAEASSTATARMRADRAELPALERDARASSSTAVTATAAGDAFLSYGMAAEAEEMYTIALTKSGADLPRILTRLGIAQADQGKAEAAATFARVEGVRAPIASLWRIYAEQNALPAPVAPAIAGPAADDTM